MTPHLVWAFVALCALGVFAWRLRRTDEETAMSKAWEEHEQELARIWGVLRPIDDITKRIGALESDLKPIKAKHSAGQFGAIGGGR